VTRIHWYVVDPMASAPTSDELGAAGIVHVTQLEQPVERIVRCRDETIQAGCGVVLRCHESCVGPPANVFGDFRQFDLKLDGRNWPALWSSRARKLSWRARFRVARGAYTAAARGVRRSLQD
jgi:hypothetical protein